MRLSAGEIEVILESDSEAYSEEENDSAGSSTNHQQDEEFEEEEQEGQQQQQQQPQTQRPQSASEWRLPSSGSQSLTTVYNFTGGPHGMKISVAPHINKTSNPLAVFMLFFAEVIRLLVVETNGYYHQYLDTLDQVVM
jgi:hypothetical protein